MNIQYLKEVVDVISVFMNENGYASVNDDLGLFKGEMKAYRVSYDDAKREFNFGVSPVDIDGNATTFSTITTWFFDEESHSPNDTKLIGEDFLEAAATNLGVKVVKTADGSTKEIAMPTKAAAGTEPGIEAFTQKFLAMFPQYKDAYRESVAKYNDFMYVDFYKRYGVEKMRELMEDEIANKKTLVKYWNMLGDMHYNGELIVGDLITTVIIAGTFGPDPAKYDTAAEIYLADYPFLKSAAKASVHDYKRNRKLRTLFEKN